MSARAHFALVLLLALLLSDCVAVVENDHGERSNQTTSEADNLKKQNEL